MGSHNFIEGKKCVAYKKYKSEPKGNKFNSMDQNLLGYFYDGIPLQFQQTRPSVTQKE